MTAFEIAQKNYRGGKGPWTQQMVQNLVGKGKLTQDQALAIFDNQTDPLLVISPVTLEEHQAVKQAQNKEALAEYLASHPLAWRDGKYYGVTEENQREMSLNLMQYQLAVQAGQPAKLEWHSVKSACTEWTLEDYTALSLAISEFVYPYLRYQEHVKEQIFEAESIEELEKILIDYESVKQV